MQIGKKGLDLIKEFEGCQLKAYKCPAGVWTIGWGTTEPINGVAIHEGMTITQKQADELLLKNLKSYESGVNRLVKVKLNQNQFDALVSFTYNCGVGALQKSTLLEKLNKGDYIGASNEFPRWNKAGGKVLKGLVRRREAERKLFLEEDVMKIKVVINGKEKEVEAIERDGNNFIKLRDIACDKIVVDYNSSKKMPTITTK